MATKLVSEEQIMEAVKEALLDLDPEQLTDLAQHMLGCRIAFVKTASIGCWTYNCYNVTPIDGYTGAFGVISMADETGKV